LQKHIAEQKAEIERLNKTVVDLNANLSEAINYFTSMESLYKIKCKELDVAKANAIKEFAERLKEKAPNITEERFHILRNEIDNLVKEMTEGKNDFKE
jgi:3-methyladenine DNA glycosylase/8-oxoguanine DNA glycosylase